MPRPRSLLRASPKQHSGIPRYGPPLRAGQRLGSATGQTGVNGTTTEPTSQASTLSSSEFSTLDAAGVDQILDTKTARLDMRSGSLKKATVRVTEASYGPEINTRGSGKIALTIAAPNGEIAGETDRMRFNTTGKRSDFSEVTYFLTADSADEYFSLIRDGVQRYGISSDSAERWISSTEKNPAKTSDFSITSGTAVGLEVNYDLRYDGAKDTQVIIVHVWPTD